MKIFTSLPFYHAAAMQRLYSYIRSICPSISIGHMVDCDETKAPSEKKFNYD